MKFKSLFYLIFTSLLLVNCESYTEDLNNDPNAFTIAASDLLIGQVQLSFIQHMGSNNARYGAVFSNQMSGGDRQYLTLNTYSPNRSNYNRMWSNTYTQGIKIARIILDDETSGQTIAGIAEILQGALFAEMAILYGDVPYSEAVDPEIINPVYDNQSSVISGGISSIAAGISKVGTSSIAAGYGGNRLAGGAWSEAGNTLAARYSLMTGDYTSAINYANSGISSTANDFVSLHGTSLDNRNLYYQFAIDERQDYLVASEAYSVSLLNGTVARALETPGNSEVYASYFLDDGGRVLLNTDDGGRFAQTSSMKLGSYVENQLILAEAKFKTGNESGALEHLNNVRADLRVQYDSADGFPDSDASGNMLLKQILEEKYLALIGELVTFHDLRRTRNFIGVPNKPTGSTGASEFPQRFLYPQSELDANENIPSPLPEFFAPTAVLSSY
ncbi:MAG: SusD/RagB family nutrient-binding outer membrane lipoprotein [Flavobacteriaceae bacterium]|nr:SusD/RagB family nutrient-binding outer membrane lipoprotein [Flavobacteriaceae bacterium]